MNKKTEPKTQSKDLGLLFEHTVRQFLGERAYGIAGASSNESSFYKYLRKCVSVMRKQVKLLDTTTRHKERLMNDLEHLNSLLRVRGCTTKNELVLTLFRLTSRLFGFDASSGRVFNQPFYHQNVQQYILVQEKWGQVDRAGAWSSHKKNVVTLQREVFFFLKNKGLSDQVIAGVLNTSEHHVKKLKHSL